MRIIGLILLGTFFSCSPQLSLSRSLAKFSETAWNKERLRPLGYKVEEDGRIVALYSSYKHIGLDEARRMIVSLRLKLQDALKDTFEDAPLTLGIEYKEEDGSFMSAEYVGKVVYKEGKNRYYVWDKSQEAYVKVFEEEAESAFGKVLGYPAPEGSAPFWHLRKS